MENLKVSVKNGKACQKILSIEVPSESIQQEYDAFYKGVAPRAKVPGFRQGKVPRNVLEMHYADQAKDHVLQNLVDRSFRKALGDSKLDPIVYPNIQDVKFDVAKLTYKAHVEVRPEIKLSKVEGLSAKKEKVDVKDKEVDESLKRLQESQAKFKAVEDRAAQMGDCVIADYACSIDGKEVEKREGEWLELKDDEFLKGFSKQLVGVKPGDEKDVTIKFPKDSARNDVSGKEGVFKVQVKEIKSKELPALDDELAKDAGEFDNLEDLKKRTKENLLKQKEQEAEGAYENALLDQLIKHNKLDLPPTLVSKRLEYLLENAKQNFKRQGLGDEHFENEKEKLSKNLTAEAEKQVKLAFLFDEIAKKNEIKVDGDAISKRIEDMSKQVPPNQMAEMKKYYESNQEAQQQMVEQIRNEKVIQYIKDNAK